MKILHVINNFDGFGGAEIALAKLINGTPQFEHKLLSLMSVSEANLSFLDDRSCVLTPLGMRSALGLVGMLIRLKRLIHKQEPTLVVGWMYMANVACSIAAARVDTSIPVIWSIHHALDNFANESRSTRWSIWASKLLKHYPVKTVYVGKRSLVQHEKFGFQGTDVQLIPHGVDVKKPLTKRRKFAGTVGVLARWHEAKDWPMIVAAIQIILRQRPDTAFILGGLHISLDNIDFKHLLQKHAIDLERVTVLGLVENTQDFYQNLDVFLIGSRTEAGPIALLEAMACGCAVVSTDVGDARQMLDKSELIIDVGDSSAMALRVLKLLAEPAECTLLGNELQRRASTRFGMNNWLRQYEELFTTTRSSESLRKS